MKHVIVSTENYVKASKGVSLGFYSFTLLELMHQKGPQNLNDLAKFWKMLRGLTQQVDDSDQKMVLSLVESMIMQGYVQVHNDKYKTTSHYNSLIDDVVEEKFERFWKIFKGEPGEVPRGTKKKAKIAWQSVLRRSSNMTPEKLIKCAENYASTLSDRKYMKYAEGFLSSDMWQNFLNLESSMSFNSEE